MILHQLLMMWQSVELCHNHCQWPEFPCPVLRGLLSLGKLLWNGYFSRLASLSMWCFCIHLHFKILLVLSGLSMAALLPVATVSLEMMEWIQIHSKGTILKLLHKLKHLTLLLHLEGWLPFEPWRIRIMLRYSQLQEWSAVISAWSNDNDIITHDFKLGNQRKDSDSAFAQIFTGVEIVGLTISVWITFLMVLCCRFILVLV